MTQKRHTDLTYLNNISMGDNTLIIEMVELFLENAPRAIQKMMELQEKKEWEQVAAQAHKFKPNLAYMGMESSKLLIEELEEHAKKKEQVDKIEDKLAELHDNCKEAYGELTRELDKIKNS